MASGCLEGKALNQPARLDEDIVTTTGMPLSPHRKYLSQPKS